MDGISVPRDPGGIDYERLVDFIRNRHRKDGCFAPVPSLPSTVADTWYGVSLCLLLDPLVPELGVAAMLDRERIRVFVQGHDELLGSLPLRICYFLGLLHEFATGNWPEFPSSLLTRASSTGPDWEHRFYLGRLFPEKSQPPVTGQPDLGRATCRDVFFFLRLGPRSDASQLGAWLRGCQNDDGGFGFFPGTTSYMEYSDYALSALHLLGDRPDNPEQASRFIRYCQTGSGGFSRSIRALPFLESSYHAVRALQVLAHMAQDRMG